MGGITIGHIAFWVNDLEVMRAFYQQYFGMKCSKKYENSHRGFSSYFLFFNTGTRIEIMNRKDIPEINIAKGLSNGFAHLAFSVGNKETVDQLTELLRHEGYKVIGEPRTTGDGYYESIILDPEGNWVEITE